MTIVSSDYMVDESQSSVEVCGRLTDIPAGGLECEVVATINTSDGPKASMSLYLYVYPKYIKYLQVNFLSAANLPVYRKQRSTKGQCSIK